MRQRVISPTTVRCHEWWRLHPKDADPKLVNTPIYQFGADLLTALSLTKPPEVPFGVLRDYVPESGITIWLPKGASMRFGTWGEQIRCDQLFITKGADQDYPNRKPTGGSIEVAAGAGATLYPITLGCFEGGTRWGSDKPAPEIPKEQQESAEMHAAATRWLIHNLLVYLDSGEPDCRVHPAPELPTTKKPAKLRRAYSKLLLEPLVEVTYVGMNWKKPVVYGCSETTVSGHFRWQPHGPGLTKLKLIWIDDHVRHFKGAVNGTQSSPHSPTAETCIPPSASED